MENEYNASNMREIDLLGEDLGNDYEAISDLCSLGLFEEFTDAILKGDVYD